MAETDSTDGAVHFVEDLEERKNSTGMGAAITMSCAETGCGFVSPIFEPIAWFW